jgi:hypothetical protein
MKTNFLKTVSVAATAVTFAISTHAIPIHGVVAFTGNATHAAATVAFTASTGGATIKGAISSAGRVTHVAPAAMNPGSSSMGFFVTSTGTANTSASRPSLPSTGGPASRLGLFGSVHTHGSSPATMAFNSIFTLSSPPSTTSSTNVVSTSSGTTRIGTVPDSGSTALLLGAVLTGLALHKRKLVPRLS